MVNGRDIIEYDIVKDLYKLEFVADGEVHFMTFDNVLSVLPKSWFKNKPRHIGLASYALLIVLLMRVAFLILTIIRFK